MWQRERWNEINGERGEGARKKGEEGERERKKELTRSNNCLAQVIGDCCLSMSNFRWGSVAGESLMELAKVDESHPRSCVCKPDSQKHISICLPSRIVAYTHSHAGWMRMPEHKLLLQNGEREEEIERQRNGLIWAFDFVPLAWKWKSAGVNAFL